MCAPTQNAATPIDHAGSPSVLLLLVALPGGSCVGRSRARAKASQNCISWHQGKRADKHPLLQKPSMLNVSVDLAVPKYSWPLRCPRHDPAAPIPHTAHTTCTPPSSLQSVLLPSGWCGVCKTPWRIKTVLRAKKWLHFPTTKRHHLPHLACSPEALSESQPVVLCWEHCCTLMGTHLCLQGAVMPALPLPGEDTAPLPALPLRGQSLGMWQARRWQQSWMRCIGMAFSSPVAASSP